MDKIRFAAQSIDNALRNLRNDPQEAKMIALSCAAAAVISYIGQTLLVPVIEWLGAEWKLWVCLAGNAPTLGLIMLTHFVSKLPAHLRKTYAACVMCQYLMGLDRTSSWFFWLFDFANYTLQGWLLLASEDERKKLEKRLDKIMRGLPESLAMAIFCVTSVAYGFILGSKVYPAVLGLDVVIAFAVLVSFVNISWCAFVNISWYAVLEKAQYSQHKHWQHYFLWASLWVQVDFSVLGGASQRLGNAVTVLVSVAIMAAITKATGSLPPC